MEPDLKDLLTHLVTKVDAMYTGLSGEIQQVRTELRQVDQRLSGEIQQLRGEVGELRGEVGELRSDLRQVDQRLSGEIQQVRAEVQTVKRVAGANHFELVGRITHVSEMLERHIADHPGPTERKREEPSFPQ